MAFVGKFVGDLGATIGAGNVLLGERLGLYRALAQQPGDARSVAAATDTDPRYVDEWLRGQAAGGYIQYDAATATYSMTPEQAFALTDPTGPVFLPGAYELALGALKAQHHIEESFRTGAGYGWGQHDEDVFTGCERFFRPGYLMHLLTEWIPALDGVQAKLERGASVADLGCGHGASTLLMADAFPASRFVGSDYHTGSIESARERAEDAGVGDRVRFDVASAQELEATGLDLVTTFDCLHDMGDPLGRGPAHPAFPGRGRYVADRRARRRRHRRVEPEPRGPGVLQLLDVPLRAQRDVAVRRLRPRRPGRRGRHPPGRHRRRLHPVPPGRRDALQQRVRSASVTGVRHRFVCGPGGSRTRGGR